jgi:hypothetical protein
MKFHEVYVGEAFVDEHNRWRVRIRPGAADVHCPRNTEGCPGGLNAAHPDRSGVYHYCGDDEVRAALRINRGILAGVKNAGGWSHPHDAAAETEAERNADPEAWEAWKEAHR